MSIAETFNCEPADDGLNYIRVAQRGQRQQGFLFSCVRRDQQKRYP